VGVLWLFPLIAAPLPAQEHAYPFRVPAVSTLESVSRLGPVHTSRDSLKRWVALAELAEQIPFWLHRDADGPVELAGTFAARAASRFDLQGSNNEFIEAHFRVGFQLRARVGHVAARAELYHVSSHLGDEFLVRTGRQPISTSREGIELLVQHEPLPGLLVYGGPGFLLRSTRNFDSPSVRGGLEWDAGRILGPFAPFFGAEIFAWSELGWNPTFSSEFGVSFGSGRYRFAGTFGAGRSRAEQFFREDETLAGFVFTVRPS